MLQDRYPPRSPSCPSLPVCAHALFTYSHMFTLCPHAYLHRFARLCHETCSGAENREMCSNAIGPLDLCLCLKVSCTEKLLSFRVSSAWVWTLKPKASICVAFGDWATGFRSCLRGDYSIRQSYFDHEITYMKVSNAVSGTQKAFRDDTWFWVDLCKWHAAGRDMDCGRGREASSPRGCVITVGRYRIRIRL